MALRTTIPTLEIKTSGTDLALVDELYVTIKKGGFQTVKSNDDIEVDNDVVSVSISQSEAAQLDGEGGANVSIMAVKSDGGILNVKIVWVRRGSRTDYGEYGGGGGSGSETESKMAWYPIVSDNGDLSWVKSATEIPPETVNIKGNAGEDGFSPTIKENPDNTDDVYRLDIINKDGSFTTPNLKGKDGSGGSMVDVSFEINADGDLIMTYENPSDANRFYIDENGDLIVVLEG